APTGGGSGRDSAPPQRKRQRKRTPTTTGRKASGQDNPVHARHVCRTGKGTIRTLLQTPHPKWKTTHRRNRRDNAKNHHNHQRKDKGQSTTTELMTHESVAPTSMQHGARCENWMPILGALRSPFGWSVKPSKGERSVQVFPVRNLIPVNFSRRVLPILWASNTCFMGTEK
ncbi:UNVERIFIED_ORG: hypothetical protein BCL66_1425, partial [Martelella mediterranea]